MYLDANWAIKPMSSEQKAKFGVVGIPSNKLRPKANLFQIYGYGISTACEHRDLAGAFLRKLTAPGGGIDKLWSVLNLAVSKTAAASGQAADTLYAPFLEELKYGRLSAYQWLNLIPAFHFTDTFHTLKHASDAERVLNEVVARTSALPRVDATNMPGW
jgi:hypothetical protein